jgi:hypothetical protein
MEYFFLFIFVFNLLFLVILPHFLWIRWIIQAFRKRRVVGRVIGPLSYLLFLMPWILVFQGNQRSYGRVASILSEDAIFLGMLIGSILLSIGYFYVRWVYIAYQEKQWKTLYIRLSTSLLAPAIVWCLILSVDLARRSDISDDLGVQLPYWGTNLTKNTNSKSGFRGEGEILADIELETDALEDLALQIRQTAFYDSSRLELYGADGIEWPKSDTVFYWKVRDHLEKNKLTGLWVYDQQRAVYEFYEPSLSDIPNGAILFKESYVISAELGLENRTLSYRRIEY